MKSDALEARPMLLSRIGGLLYLIIIAGGVFGEGFIRGRVIVPGNAEATAANLQSMSGLWRLGMASEIFMLCCGVGLTLVLFVLLRPVSRDLAWLAVFFNLMTIAIEGENEINLVEALLPLDEESYRSEFSAGQLAVLSHLSVRFYAYGFGTDLIFFGFACLVLGVLIYLSGYLPKTIGVSMFIAGICYLVNSFALILSPPLASRIFPAILIPSFLAESAFCLWLLIRGVDLPRYRAALASPVAADPMPH